MSGKQLLIIIIVSSLSFLLITGAGGYVYLYKPELVGLPTHKPGQDTLPPPPTPAEIEANRLRAANDSLSKQMQSMNDSLQKTLQKASTLAQETQSLKSQVDEKKKQEQAQQEKARKDSLQLKNIQAFAEMYDKAEPTEVAKILAKADTPYAARILQLMKRKNAAKVIEHLPTEKAVAVAKVVID